MKRKIIKLGSATLVTSLPSKWAKKLNIKAGSEVNLSEEGDRLIISTKKANEKKKHQVELTQLHPLINYGLVGLFMKGIDELHVTSEDSKLIGRLQGKPINQCIGWEIIKQGKNECIIQDISGEGDMNFNSVIRRVFFIINGISEEILNAMENGTTKLNHLDAVDINANRFSFLLNRKLLRQGYTEFEKTPVMFYIGTMLEATGDLYRDLGMYIAEKNLKVSKKSVTLFKRVNSFFIAFQELFFKFDVRKAAKLDKEYREFRVEIDKYIDAIKNPREMRCLIFMANIADYVSEMYRNHLIIAL